MPSKPRSVAEEIAQGRPFPSPGQELVVTLLRTTDEVRRVLSSVIEPHGVTLQQYNVLRILRGAGPGGLPTLEIGRRMVERQPGVTRLVDRLVAKGLVARTRGVADRRRVVCAIGPEGLRVLEDLDREVLRMDRAVTGEFTDAETARLTGALNRLRSAVSAELGESED